MGFGEALLRLLYTRLGPPLRFYRRTGVAACTTRPRVVLDVGGGSGRLARSLECSYELYILLDPDPVLIEATARGARVERVVGDGRRPPLRHIAGCTAVLHDALHHILDWRESLASMLEPCDCVVVSDYDSSRFAGKLLALFERLLGFPAVFTDPGRLSGLLEGIGFSIAERSDGFNYLLVACRHSK